MATVIGRVSAILAMDTTRWRQGLRQAETSLSKTATRVASNATKLSVGFSLPLAAAGAATSKFARNFETEVTKINTLVGVSRTQVDKWAVSLLQLGPQLGRGPNELSQALFKVTSAGERGANALDIVAQAAKASVVGLGDTATVADALTSAMQAYASSGLTAEQATDVLTATVREGKLEADALAGSLGRVIGIAAQVGVSFAQVGAFVATFTRLGVSSEEATTALRGVLNTLLKPSKQAATALKSVGLSSQELRDQVGKQGLTQTLLDLVEAFRGNEEGLAQVIPNVRALSGVLGTAGSQGDAFVQILESIENSAGITNEAFQATTQTSQFTLDQFRASLEATAIQLGNRLAPSFDAALRSMQPFLNLAVAAGNVFGALPGPVQSLTLGMLGLLAAAGPLGFVFSGLTAALSGIAAFLGTASISMGTAALVAGGLVTGVVALNGVFDALTGESKELAPELQEVEDKLGSLAGIAKRAKIPIRELVKEFPKGRTGADLLGEAIENVDRRRANPTPTPPPPQGTPGVRPVVTPPPSPTGGSTATASNPRPTPGSTSTPTPPVQVPVLLQRPAEAAYVAEVNAEFQRLKAAQVPVELVPQEGQDVSASGEIIDIPEDLKTEAITKGLDEISLAAQILGPSFDAAGKRVEFLEGKLEEAAEAGLSPLSSTVEDLRGKLANARRDTSGMERDLDQLAERAGEPGFDVMEAQIGRVTEELQRMRDSGIAETDPAIEGLKSRIESIAASSPGVVAALESIDRQAAVIGPSFDGTGQKIQFLQDRIKRLAEIGGDAAKGIRELQQQIARLGLEAGPTGLEIQIATQQASNFGDQQAALRAQLQGIGSQLNAVTAAYVTARQQLGDAAPETAALRDRVEELRFEYRELNSELGNLKLDEAVAKVSQKPGTGTGFSLSALAGQGRQGPTALEGVQAEIGAQQQALGEQQGLAPGLQDPAMIAAIEENIAGLQQYEAALLGVQGVAQSVSGAIGSAFQQSVQGIIQGTTTVDQAFANMGLNILISWGATLAEMLAMEIANFAIRLATEEGFLASKLGLQALFGQAEVANTALVEGEKTGITFGGILTRIGGYALELAAGVAAAVGVGAAWIGSALGSGAAWIATFAIMVAGFIATAAVAIAEAIGVALAWIAPAAVAAFTALASIPVVGPFLAFAAVAAVIGGLTALVLSFASGGAELTEDQLVYAHKRELIIPADIAGGLTSMIRAGRAPGMSGNQGSQEVGQLRSVGAVAPSTAFQAQQVSRGLATGRRVPDIEEGGRGGVTLTGPLIQPQIGAIDGASVDELFRESRETLVSEAMEELRLRLAEGLT